jgi:hypothetical protein
MPSPRPTSINVFLTPVTAATAEELAARDGVPLATILRAAVMHSCASFSANYKADPLAYRASVPGRTRRTMFYLDAEMKRIIRELCYLNSIPQSRFVANALDGFLADLAQEERGTPSVTLRRMRNKAREKIAQSVSVSQ